VMKKQSRSECVALLAKMENKYRNLVWFVRNQLREDDRTAQIAVDPFDCAARSKQIASEYPDECGRLDGYDRTRDWEHGFNCGCLAAFRLAFGLTGDKDEQCCAISQFPNKGTYPLT